MNTLFEILKWLLTMIFRFLLIMLGALVLGIFQPKTAKQKR